MWTVRNMLPLHAHSFTIVSRCSDRRATADGMAKITLAIIHGSSPRAHAIPYPWLEIVLDRLPRECGEARDQDLPDQGAQGFRIIGARTPADDLTHRRGSPHKQPG